MRSRASVSASSARRSQAAAAVVDLVGRHAQAAGVEIDAVELAGQLDERAVAARAHVGNDGAHRLLDVGRGLALGGEEGAETGGKIGGAGVETDRHGSSSMTRRRMARQSLVPRTSTEHVQQGAARTTTMPSISMVVLITGKSKWRAVKRPANSLAPVEKRKLPAKARSSVPLSRAGRTSQRLVAGLRVHAKPTCETA